MKIFQNLGLCKIVVHISTIQRKYILNHQVGFWIDPYRSFGWDHSVSFSRYAHTLPCEYKKCTLCVCSMHGLFFQDSNIRSYFSMPHVSGVFARSALLKELNLSHLAHTHTHGFLETTITCCPIQNYYYILALGFQYHVWPPEFRK